MNYEEYHYSKGELIRYLSVGLLVSSSLSYLFYRSIFAVILFSPFSLLYVKKKKKVLIEQRKWQLNLEFREAVICLSAALNTGYSIENAFREAIKDLKMMYSEDAIIIREFEHITNQLNMNKTVEEALSELAARSQVEDIYNFSEVFVTAKRTGGDIIKIIKTTSRNIGDKIEIKREIQTLITAKKFEARIMNLIPFGIILYMWVCSPGFLDPLYHNVIGVLIMTIALFLYYIAYTLAEKIMKIEV
jgi:Flp pilus assembly protein TadB